MEEKDKCPHCENHCTQDALACGKGKRYFKNEEDECSIQKEGKDNRKHGHHRHCHEESNDIDETLHMLMRRCTHVLRHRSGEKSGQGRVLRILSKDENITQKELMERLEVKAGSLSELLSKLEQNQLIIRTQNEQDKRGVDVTLSEQGKEVVKTLKDNRHQQSKEMFACLDENEKEVFAQILEKLLKTWKQDFPHPHHHKEK